MLCEPRDVRFGRNIKHCVTEGEGPADCGEAEAEQK